MVIEEEPEAVETEEEEEEERETKKERTERSESKETGYSTCMPKESQRIFMMVGGHGNEPSGRPGNRRGRSRRP